MGWGNCGTDSQGRPIGYVFEAICDHPDCNEVIDRGLSYVCGDMHGEDEYFCEKHKHSVQYPDGTCTSLCDDCYDLYVKMIKEEWPGDVDKLDDLAGEVYTNKELIELGLEHLTTVD